MRPAPLPVVLNRLHSRWMSHDSIPLQLLRRVRHLLAESDSMSVFHHRRSRSRIIDSFAACSIAVQGSIWLLHPNKVYANARHA